MTEPFPILTLKPGRDAHLQNRHLAIFRTAVERDPAAEDGAIVEVQSSDGTFLCYATLNRNAYICGRAIAFERGDPLRTVARNMERAFALRKAFFAREDTTAYRLINAEGDEIPGLILDRYGDVLCVQCTTLGMDRLRPWVIETLQTMLKPQAIYEKSTGAARKKEGLQDKEGWVAGTPQPAIHITERGMQFLITLEGSQKTGLFLDQREMRSLVRQYAKGRTVLDCCSYVGGFSVAALLGGASACDTVDYDKDTIEAVHTHVAMNGIDPHMCNAICDDVFNVLRKIPLPRAYDFIILDPPAFAKRSTDLERAKKAYIDLNRMAMKHLPSGGLLLSCSCSYHIDPELFQTIVFHAARQAKRSIKIIQRHRQAMDHPVNLYHPEGDYLKSLLLWIE